MSLCTNPVIEYAISSRGHATPPFRVGRSEGRSVTNFVEFRAIIALRPLPNRPRLSCHVSGLVYHCPCPQKSNLGSRVSGIVLLLWRTEYDVIQNEWINISGQSWLFFFLLLWSKVPSRNWRWRWRCSYISMPLVWVWANFWMTWQSSGNHVCYLAN